MGNTAPSMSAAAAGNSGGLGGVQSPADMQALDRELARQLMHHDDSNNSGGGLGASAAAAAAA